ncbi:hypothetical protein EFW59_04251 [Bacillus subtilis]|nr:hypothetical protein EFW59_04251 [Bacillus subtilis]
MINILENITYFMFPKFSVAEGFYDAIIFCFTYNNSLISF